MTDGILDLLAAILVLGIVLAIAFGFIIPLTSNDLMQYDTKYEDKAILNDITDYSDSDNFDGISRRMYSYEELVLLFAVQDNRMEEPKEISLRNLITFDNMYLSKYNKFDCNTPKNTSDGDGSKPDIILQTIRFYGKHKRDLVFPENYANSDFASEEYSGVIRITDDYPLVVDEMALVLTKSDLATDSKLSDSEKRYFITYQYAIPSDAKYLDGHDEYKRKYFDEPYYVVHIDGNWFKNSVYRDTYKEYQNIVSEIREFAVEH